ncbi:MAG: hypothetical protein JSR18_01340 [Proteobacteria bacterium]|nr:hypothetical protein [Pseudomonadota bacterium]
MIFGMSTAAFTTLHVLLSLIGIAAGLLALGAMYGSRVPRFVTGVFLATTILTSVTGYFFPRDHILPSHIVGAISLVVLLVAVLALYRYRLVGRARGTYVIAAVVSLYLNVFVLFAQAFAKIPALHDMAPTQSEPPFVVTQVIVLLAFAWAGYAAFRRFRPPPA